MNLRLPKWWMLMPALLLPWNASATEPANSTNSPAIDLSLPIHQQNKLHPELSDPVLGDQAQIIEWAWSPQYAKRFGLQPQADGLLDGALWLVGVKIERKQYREAQRYTCNIVGLMQNNLPILTPDGDVYTAPPDYVWSGGLPGEIRTVLVVKDFTPAQVTWYKQPKNKLEQTRPERGNTRNYLHYYRRFRNDLAYFEIEAGGCSYFNDPALFRNEIRFPTRADGGIGVAVYEPGAIKFDLPDGLMRRIYPYTLEAVDWTSCFLRRAGNKSMSLRSRQSRRFGNACEPEPVGQRDK